MPVIVEPNLALPYWQPSSDFINGEISDQLGIYLISVETLRTRWNTIEVSLQQGSTVIVEGNVESVATLWYLVKNIYHEPWIKQGQLRFLTGGSGDSNIRNLNSEYFVSATLTSQIDLPSTPDLAPVRPYTFLFTNRKLRPHRRYLISRLKQTGALDRALWTCRETDDCWSHPEFNKIYCYDQLEQKILPPGYDPEVPPDWIDGVVYPQQYQDTWFSVVSETVFEYPYSFRTEKTYRTILAGHPFVICANRGFYRDLRNLGFKTFHSWIDESFDLIDDGKQRLDRVVETVNWLLRQDLESFWLETSQIRLYNQQCLHELHNRLRADFMHDLKEFANA